MSICRRSRASSSAPPIRSTTLTPSIIRNCSCGHSGTYSIKVVDPIKFYTEAIPKNAEHVDISDINEQYLSEFLGALQAAINQMSADGVRISHVTSKNMELSRYMADILDDDWKDLRGMEVVSVGLAGLSYSEESQKLINMRNQGAMLSDPNVREGYVQGSVARGLEAAGFQLCRQYGRFYGHGPWNECRRQLCRRCFPGQPGSAGGRGPSGCSR